MNDVDKYISLEVTPMASVGETTGTPIESQSSVRIENSAPSDTTPPNALVNVAAYNGTNGFSILMNEESTVTIGFHGSLKYKGASVSSSVVGMGATFNVSAPGAVNHNQIFFKITDAANNESYYLAEMHSGVWMIFDMPSFTPDQP